MKIGRAIFARDFFLMENEVFDQLLHPAANAAACWYHDEIIIPNEIGVMVGCLHQLGTYLLSIDADDHWGKFII